MPAAKDIDAIIVNGEGTMYGAPNRKNAVALSEIGQYAKQFYNCPAALINATFYANDAAFYDARTF